MQSGALLVPFMLEFCDAAITLFRKNLFCHIGLLRCLQQGEPEPWPGVCLLWRERTCLREAQEAAEQSCCRACRPQEARGNRSGKVEEAADVPS